MICIYIAPRAAAPPSQPTSISWLCVWRILTRAYGRVQYSRSAMESLHPATFPDKDEAREAMCLFSGEAHNQSPAQEILCNNTSSFWQLAAPAHDGKSPVGRTTVNEVLFFFLPSSPESEEEKKIPLFVVCNHEHWLHLASLDLQIFPVPLCSSADRCM